MGKKKEKKIKINRFYRIVDHDGIPTNMGLILLAKRAKDIFTFLPIGLDVENAPEDHICFGSTFRMEYYFHPKGIMTGEINSSSLRPLKEGPKDPINEIMGLKEIILLGNMNPEGFYPPPCFGGKPPNPEHLDYALNLSVKEVPVW